MGKSKAIEDRIKGISLAYDLILIVIVPFLGFGAELDGVLKAIFWD